MKSILLIIAAFIAVCSAFSFTGNFSSSVVVDNGWHYRSDDFFDINLPLIYIGANVLSINASANLQTGSFDAVAASAYIPVLGFPFAYIAYFKANYNLNAWSTIGQAAATFDVSAATGFVGTAALRLEARTPSGSLVSTKSLQWNGITALSYTQTGVSQSSDDIQYIEFTGTGSHNFTFKVSYLTSCRAGIVDKTIPLVPGSLESIYQISNYPYQDKSNTLSLIIAVGSGDATATVTGQTLVSSNNSVYFSVSHEAVVDGSSKSISVSDFVSGSVSDLNNDAFSAQLSGRYGAQASAHFVTITFPAGANTIIYDPTIGAGASSANDVQSTQGSSASAVVPLMSLLLFSALLMA